MTRAPLHALRRAATTNTPLAPVHAATVSQLLEIEPGRCVASMPGIPDDPDLGLWVLTDFVTGLALTGTIGPGERITTLRLTLQVVAPVPAGELRASAELVHAADGVGITQGVVTDPDGSTVARSTARNAVLHDESGDTFDGPARAFEATPWTAAALLGLRETGAGPVARPDRASTNAADVVQGGVLAALAWRALGRSLERRPQEMSATFLRAAPPDGEVRADVVVEHAGRRLRSGRVELTDARGKTVLTASGIAYAAH